MRRNRSLVDDLCTTMLSMAIEARAKTTLNTKNIFVDEVMLQTIVHHDWDNAISARGISLQITNSNRPLLPVVFHCNPDHIQPFFGLPNCVYLCSPHGHLHSCLPSIEIFAAVAMPITSHSLLRDATHCATLLVMIPSLIDTAISLCNRSDYFWMAVFHILLHSIDRLFIMVIIIDNAF